VSTARRVGLALVLAVLALFAALSLRYGGSAALAHSQVLATQNIVFDWRAGRVPSISQKRWEEMRDQMLQALATAPDNTVLHEDLGFWYWLRAGSQANPSASLAEQQYRKSLLDEAVHHYRVACGLRPAYPYTWAYLALVKHALGQPDAEFYLAFDRALRHGRTEAGIQPPIANIAFERWGEIGAQRQQQVIAMVQEAHASNQAYLRGLAQQASVTLPAAP
jgi:hypothetical protein